MWHCRKWSIVTSLYKHRVIQLKFIYMKRKSLSYKLTIMLTVCDITEISKDSELIYDKTAYIDGYHYYMLTPKVKDFDFISLIQQCKNINTFVNNWFSEVENYIKTKDGSKLF